MANENSPSGRPKPHKINRFMISLNVGVQLFVLVLIVLMLNYLSFNHYRRWNFSRTHRYELSDKTHRVLAGLKKPVKVIEYFSQGSDVAGDIDNLLKEYEGASKNIQVVRVDPGRNPALAHSVESEYKLGEKENIVIIDSGGRKKYIMAQEMVDYDHTPESYGQPPSIKDFKGEQEITGGILEVNEDRANNLYAISGHGERDIMSDDYSIVRTALERENIKVQPLALVEFVPSDAGVLLVLGARYDFSESEIQLIRDYWEKKGRLIILLDPEAKTPRLNAFLRDQGIKPDDDRILRVTQTQVATVAGLIKDVTGEFIQGSPITKHLKDVLGIFPGGTQSLTFDIPKIQSGGIQPEILVQASKGYWGESDYVLHNGDPVPYFDATKDHGQPLAVVVSLEKGGLTDKRVQVAASRMIVAGNWQFVSNQSLTAANLDFAVSSFDWLLDREELISIPPKANAFLVLELTDAAMSKILLIGMGLIPGIAAVLGFGIWWKRRH